MGVGLAGVGRACVERACVGRAFVGQAFVRRAFVGACVGVSGGAVGCVSASSLGRRAGSGAAPFVAAYGCVGASSLVRAGRQRGQRVHPG